MKKRNMTRYLTINVFLSLIKMYLDDICRYEKGDKIRKMKMSKLGESKTQISKRIKNVIGECNLHAPIELNQLSETATKTVNRMESMGFTGLQINLS